MTKLITVTIMVLLKYEENVQKALIPKAFEPFAVLYFLEKKNTRKRPTAAVLHTQRSYLLQRGASLFLLCNITTTKESDLKYIKTKQFHFSHSIICPY